MRSHLGRLGPDSGEGIPQSGLGSHGQVDAGKARVHAAERPWEPEPIKSLSVPMLVGGGN